MVDTLDLFRRLSSGAKYDRRRLSKELAAFQVIMRRTVHCSFIPNVFPGQSDCG